MNNTALTEAIKRLLFGKPIKGEPINNKPKTRTVMPCDDITLLQWCRGGWNQYLNQKTNSNENR